MQTITEMKLLAEVLVKALKAYFCDNKEMLRFINEQVKDKNLTMKYIKGLLLSNFSKSYKLNENSLEKKFRKYLREIESKLSILFFFGLFFPLGLCFLILFQRINYIILISVLPLFFINDKAVS